MEALNGMEVATREDWTNLQIQDLAAVGNTLLALACGPLPGVSLEACASLFTLELRQILHNLITAGMGGFTDYQQVSTSPCCVADK
jgi:hypothetical protein